MKISADKRNKLILVAAATVGALAAIWIFLVGSQRATLHGLTGQYQEKIDQQRHIKNAVLNASQLDARLAAAEQKLAFAEEEMASGDLYSWMYTTLKNFKAPYRVDIPQFSTVELAENNLIYNFPYKQVKIAVSGTAFFQDFGRFVADMENHFPYFRVENLTLEPGSGAERDADREKLAFHMEIIALVNSAAANKK